jgi:hypothetical protein
MIYKEKFFSTVTMPNTFWEVVTRCMESTDFVLLNKFLAECENSSFFTGQLTEEKFYELFKEFAFSFGNGIVKMGKAKKQLIYNVEAFGNKRRVMVQLPSQFKNKIIDLTQRNMHEVVSSHLLGETIRNIKFIYSYNPDKDKTFVKFEIHKFVKNVEIIEVLIQLAVDKLEEIR